MEEATLEQILQSRDRRAERQTAFLETYQVPLISYTMNIPGPVKDSPLIRRAFDAGLAALDERLPAEKIRCRHVQRCVTGCEALYAVSMDPAALKALCTALEDGSSLGRLFDMDVLDRTGRKLDREAVGGKRRDCIVCGAPGRGCAVRRTHTVAELQAAVRRIITEHFAARDAEFLADAAVQSLVDEVHTTPKPGLVDDNNTGSHTDMNVDMFLASARALRPYFRRCVELGIKTAGKRPEATFSHLRQAGLEAERQMYLATGGVNTHKGIIYTMGVLCGCIGRLWAPERPVAGCSRLLDECARVTAASVEADFAQMKEDDPSATAGQCLYLRQRLTGVRGQAAAGLPAVRDIGLPAYRDCLDAGLTPNHAAAVTLLHLIAGVEDTNLYHRGGTEGARYAASAAAGLLKKNRYPAPEEILRLDADFIRANLSPGGCADLLAVTCFLSSLEFGE